MSLKPWTKLSGLDSFNRFHSFFFLSVRIVFDSLLYENMHQVNHSLTL